VSHEPRRVQKSFEGLQKTGTGEEETATSCAVKAKKMPRRRKEGPSKPKHNI